MNRKYVVAVIGGAQCSAEEAGAAEELGRGIAQRGHVLLCGGRGGVMAAACRGASAEGGMTIGVLPGTDPAEANPHVSIAIPTGLGEGRNLVVARGGDVVLAVGGSHGTLSEIAFALKAGRPVIGLWTWQAEDGRGTPAGLRPATSAEVALLWMDEALAETEVG